MSEAANAIGIEAAGHLSRAVTAILTDPIGADVMTTGKTRSSRTSAGTQDLLERAISAASEGPAKVEAARELDRARACWWRLALTEERAARRYAGRYASSMGVNAEEAGQEAVIGLLEAARRFDPARGIPFRGYAMWWVRKYVRGYAFANCAVAHRPGKLLGAVLNSYRVELDGMTPDQKAEAVGISAEAIAASAVSGTVWIDAAFASGEAEVYGTKGDILEELASDPSESLERGIELRQRIAMLSPGDRDMLALYLSHKSTSKIARMLDISRQSVLNAIVSAKLALGEVAESKVHPRIRAAAAWVELFPGHTAPRIALEVGKPIPLVVAWLEGAEREGLVRVDSAGKYSLTDAGSMDRELIGRVEEAVRSGARFPESVSKKTGLTLPCTRTLIKRAIQSGRLIRTANGLEARKAA